MPQHNVNLLLELFNCPLPQDFVRNNGPLDGFALLWEQQPGFIRFELSNVFFIEGEVVSSRRNAAAFQLGGLISLCGTAYHLKFNNKYLCI